MWGERGAPGWCRAEGPGWPERSLHLWEDAGAGRSGIGVQVRLFFSWEWSCENISITSVPRWGMPMSMFWCLGRQQSVAASCSIPSWATSSLHCITKHTDKCFFFFFPDHRATRPLSPSHELPLLAHTPASPYQQGGAGATRQLQPRLFAAFWHWVEMPRHWVPCLATLRPRDLRKDWL